MAVTPWVVSDELWELVEPLLPRRERRFRYPGRKRLPDREALCGILFVLHTGIAWQHLPQELGFGSGITCWRRLDEWQAGRRLGGAARAVARVLTGGGRARLVTSGRRLQPRAGEKGGAKTSPSPVDRARAGSKHHLLVDASGIPLAFGLTGGNRNDVTQLIPLVDSVPAVRGRVGRPRKRPRCLVADRGYDHDRYRRQLRQRGIKPVITRRKTEHGSGLGRYRWVVERTFA